jgi:hypothetical protein
MTPNPYDQASRYAAKIEQAGFVRWPVDGLTRLWLELRPPGQPNGRFELVAALVNLTGSGRTSRDMTLPNTGLRTCLRLAARNLAEEDAAETLSKIEEGRTAATFFPGFR